MHQFYNYFKSVYNIIIILSKEDMFFSLDFRNLWYHIRGFDYNIQLIINCKKRWIWGRLWIIILFVFAGSDLGAKFLPPNGTLMQIRCVSSSEIPLRSRRCLNEKSWMRNPSQRQSQFSHHQNLSSARARANRDPGFKFPRMSSLELALSRRIYLRGSALPAASSAAPRLTIARSFLSRDFSISGLYAVTVTAPGYNIVLIYRRMTRLRSSDANSGSGSARLCATCCTFPRS